MQGKTLESRSQKTKNKINIKKAGKGSKGTKPIAFLFIILCTVFTTLGQFLLKKGTEEVSGLVGFVNPFIIFGILSYAFSSVLLIISLKNGELSVLYPFIATSFIWVTLISRFILNENISQMRWFGVATIVVGVIFVGGGSK